ncbi:MAG: dihydrolipoamide acetyltransferase family protein [Rhodothermales bacterium]
MEREGDGRIKSSPLARSMAREHGIELETLRGSGPEGRIIKRDVEAVLGEAVAAPASAPRKEPPAVKGPALPAEDEEGYQVQRITQMRKTIARRLAQSKYTAPHFYLTIDVDMESAAASRQRINEIAEKQKGPRISFNDLITKACAIALRKHPQVNSSYLEQEGEIRTHNQVHVAVAVALPEGLVTPVIRNADRKSLSQIALETRALAEKARNRELQQPDWEGSTFTTSNLGMFGIEEFTAIINPPNACILAIGAVRDVPVVKNGEVVPGKRMKLTLSCDHRIVDGATGSEFLSTVRQYLEEPLTMLL